MKRNLHNLYSLYMKYLTVYFENMKNKKKSIIKNAFIKIQLCLQIVEICTCKTE